MPLLLLNLGLACIFKGHTKHLLSDVCGATNKKTTTAVVVLPTLEGAWIPMAQGNYANGVTMIHWRPCAPRTVCWCGAGSRYLMRRHGYSPSEFSLLLK